MKQFAELEDYFEGSPIVICGNAPSLADVPVELFKKYPTIGVNSVYTHAYFKDNPVSVYCIEGYGHLKAEAERKARMPYIQQVADAGGFSLVNKRVAQHFQHLPEVYFIDYMSPRGHIHQSFEFDPFNVYGSGYCVTFAALQFAYYLTSGAVLLVGMDHKFSGDSWHFFEDEKAPEFKTMEKKEYSLFRKRVDPKFEEAAEVYKVTDRELINLTPDSEATMFEAGSVDEWISK